MPFHSPRRPVVFVNSYAFFIYFLVRTFILFLPFPTSDSTEGICAVMMIFRAVDQANDIPGKQDAEGQNFPHDQKVVETL